MTYGTHDLVWYVAYGSNLHAARLRCYLAGGRPPGARRTYPGCRDRTEPRAAAAVRVPGRLVFAGRSTVWGGGVAGHDPTAEGTLAARAYLVTRGQLSDLVAQETRQQPGRDLALDGAIRNASGLYDTVAQVGHRDGHPMLTLATRGEVTTASPSASYLRVIMSGLAETFGWDVDRRVEYLLAARGLGPRWTAPRLAELAREARGPVP